MNATRNKEVVTNMFEGINEGDYEPFKSSIAENFTVNVIGSTPLSKTYVGIKDISENFIAKVVSALKVQPKVVIDKLIADDEHVVVIAHGEGGLSQDGKPYNNSYCHVMRFEDGKIVESNEYLDTALVNDALAIHLN